MDDFDELYQDELDAIDDFDDMQYDGVLVRGKKSLDFSTPSSIRQSSKRDTEGRHDDSLLIRPLEDSIESADDNVFPSNQTKRKRSDNDVYGGLSDDDADLNKENTEADDIPTLKRHERKRPKIVSDDQPIPDEFDISPPQSPEIVKKLRQPSQGPAILAQSRHGNQRQPVPDEFDISPPSSPDTIKKIKANLRPMSTQHRSQSSQHQEKASSDTDKSAYGARTKQKSDQNDDKMSAEERRITENYDFERKRVLRRIPFERDFISVSNSIGRKFYMELRDEEIEMENEAQEWSHSSLGFLGVPISVLRAQIEEDKRAKETQLHQALSSRHGSDQGRYPESIDELPELCEMDDHGVDSFVDSHGLWVDRYSPHRYTELLSDESTNRLLLKWLKLWDYVVFGREKKPPSQHAIEKAKKKENAQNKFFNKFAPEVIEELDNHQRPMQKVALLCGPPGLGKTTLGHVIAKHAGYNVVEMNASDDRSVEVFKQKVESAIHMKSVLEADPRPNCLIVDEIDGAPTPAINALLNIIKTTDATQDTKKKKKKASLLLRPIICICNDLYAPALRQLRQNALVVNFPMTESTKLAGRLLEITKLENMKSDLTTLLALCEKAENDIRSCINTLQFVKGRCRELSTHSVHSMSLGQKDVNKSLITVWKHVFTMPRQKKKRYVNPYDRAGGVAVIDLDEAMQQNNTSLTSRFRDTLHIVDSAGEWDKVLHGLFENYLTPKVKDPHMDSCLLGCEWLGFQDLLNTQIMTSQNFTLMRYTSYISVLFHLLFASTTSFKVQYPQGSEMNTRRIKSENLVASMVSDVAPSVRKNLNVHVTVMEFIPYLTYILQPTLRPVNTQLYSTREKQDLTTLINIMIAYNITYRQERAEDGQYGYVLDPNLDELVHYPNMKTKKQLTYAMKQLIAREVDLERMRRSEWQEGDLPTGVTKAEPEQTVKEESKTKEPKNNDAKEEVKELPNHLRQTLQPKAIKESRAVAKDFFGRKIEKKIIEAKKEKKKEDTIGGEIWFSFKEGFSNAVRRTVRVKEFM